MESVAQGTGSPGGLDRWKEDLIFYGYQKHADGNWVNTYNSAMALLSEEDGLGYGNFSVRNAACTFRFNLRKTPEIARLMAEGLLFADSDGWDERYGSVPDISTKVLPHIFSGMKRRDSHVRSPALMKDILGMFKANVETIMQEIEDSEPSPEQIEKVMEIGYMLAEFWDIAHRDMLMTVTVMPSEERAETGEPVYNVHPLFVDMLKKLVYG